MCIYVSSFAFYPNAPQEKASRLRFRVMQRCTLHSVASADFTWKMGVGSSTHTAHHVDAPHLTPARNLPSRRVNITNVVPRDPDICLREIDEIKKACSIGIHLGVMNLSSSPGPELISHSLRLPVLIYFNILSVLIQETSFKTRF